MATTINTRYVDVDADSGGDGTTNALTGANCAYKSLAIWEAARDGDLTSGDGGGNYVVEKVVCGSAHANHTADTTCVSLTDWTTSANSYIWITTDANNRAGCSWDTSKYRLEGANDTVVYTLANYFRIDGLQIGHSAISNVQGVIRVAAAAAAANDMRISGCLLRGANDTANAQAGIQIYDADAIVTVWNTVIFGIGIKADSNNAGIISEATSLSLSGCTIVGGYYGVRAASGATIVAKNCYASGSNSAWLADGTITMTNCASSDTTASGTDPHDSVAYSTDTFVNVTAGSQDYHLAGTGSGLYGHGSSNTGDTAPLNYTTDIDGDTITGRFDIGADWYYAAPTGQFARPAFYYAQS